jgi:predicted trehalose synthase
MLERPSESHDDRRTAGYFLRDLRALLRTLDYHAEPLYIGKKTPL